MSSALTSVTATGRSVRYINAIVDEVCCAGGELVIRHYDPAWSGTPPMNLIPAIETVMEPHWRALTEHQPAVAKSSVVVILGYIRGFSVYHIITTTTGMPACGWEPVRTTNTLYPALPESARHSRVWRVCKHCHRYMMRSAGR